ncbi:SNF2 family domain-containing protein [Colletotrichum navitas]|uniref:SNF2 family domain-containing protein n=1 Tax=Colletotrichum navitas TaxID=681940 RepID=A0AAD8V7G0_9PEZI|nr:SNF2 family domain-containing protein [Colletotrichum navitas]KAK1597107.1 SNF2 family domain-containing protein [Colletotrichum navitas]
MASLKRLLNEEDEELHYPDLSSVSSYGSIPSPYQAEQDYTGHQPRQIQFQGLDMSQETNGLENPASMNEDYNTLFPYTDSSQLEPINFGDRPGAVPFDFGQELLIWGRNIIAATPASHTYSSPQPSPGSSQDSQPLTHSPWLIPGCSSIAGSDTSFSAGDDETEIVCYGMLYNVDVKLVGDMGVFDTKIRDTHQRESMHAPPGQTPCQRFTLSENRDHVVLVFRDDPDATEFGYLRSGPGKTLARLLAQEGLEFDSVAQTTTLRETIGRAKKPVEAMVKVDINIYGPRSRAHETGKTLSEGKLYLQMPDHARSGLPYENPHMLRIKDAEHMVTEAARGVNSRAPTGRQPREERLRDMMLEVYQSIQNKRHLRREDGAKGLKHELQEHQKQALAFMLERESGHIVDSAYRLWQPVVEEGQEWFRHKITNIKQKTQPDEKGGGILADEMGMGKSLSILSLIVTTLPNGQEWAQQEEQNNEKSRELCCSGSTLVVVSSALLIYEWNNEIAKHVEGKLNQIVYHGPKREKDIDKIKNSNIVVTTYNTLAAEYDKKSSPLHKIGWYRVVLDEAHVIRRPATTFFSSCRALHAKSRWCLTGTPIQNKLADIGALFAFIRAKPFDEPAMFRRYIEVPFEQHGDPEKVKDRLIMLLDSLCLRRTKEILELPGLEERVKELEFTPAEREQYDKTKKILMRTIKQKVGEVEKSSKFGLFQANLQLRILCNHGTYQKPFSWSRRSYRMNRLEEREAAVSALGQNAEITCNGCKLPMPILGSSRLRNGAEEQCQHVLCSECLDESDMSAPGSRTRHCPMCKFDGPSASGGDVAMADAPAKTSADKDDELYFNQEGYSTKMDALIRDVEEDVWKTKSIVFSCWTRTLHLVGMHLERAGVRFAMIDGNCPLSERQKMLEKFAKDGDLRVLIMTTGTGAFGLNLTCANRVFIVELQWNPSVENQAIARAIRFGQDQKVLVTRYVIKGTVEEVFVPRSTFIEGCLFLFFPSPR